MLPGQPPPGMMTPVPAAQASPNLGAAANAANKVKQALIVLEESLPGIPLDSPLHQAVRTAINGLSKSLPQMSEGAGPGLQQSMLRDMAMRQQTMAPMIAGMQGGGAPGGQPAPQPA